MSEAVRKETKAQRAERLKQEKNPWQAFDEVRAFAREGRTSVTQEWASTYFKWWGIYTQGDGAGVTGGKGGEGVTSDYFMMRIGIPNGILNAKQLRAIGELTLKYARNLADITVRQAIQLHWLTIESLPGIVDALDAVGLSPRGACGDVVRNVTGCPLAGVDADEAFDASPVALEAARLLTANPDFYNLPRKFKIAVNGAPKDRAAIKVHDIGYQIVKKIAAGGFEVVVGGNRHQDRFAFLLRRQPHPVVEGCTGRRREGLHLVDFADLARPWRRAPC